MKKWLLRILTALQLSVAATHASLMVNGDFSIGLDGWLSSGAVSTIGGGAVLTDNNVLRSILYQGVYLEAGVYFLSFDFINVLSPAVPSGQSPDTVYVSMYYSSTPLTFDPVASTGFSSFNALLDVDRQSTNAYAGIVSSSLAGGSFRTYSSSITVPQASTAFFVIDALSDNTIDNDSSFFVDNVSLVVPEPSIIGLFLAGAAVALRRMRHRNQA